MKTCLKGLIDRLHDLVLVSISYDIMSLQICIIFHYDAFNNIYIIQLSKHLRVYYNDSLSYVNMFVI